MAQPDSAFNLYLPGSLQLVLVEFADVFSSKLKNLPQMRISLTRERLNFLRLDSQVTKHNAVELPGKFKDGRITLFPDSREDFRHPGFDFRMRLRPP